MRLRPYVRIIREVVVRTSDDGFIHAGNLAYLSLTSLFPIFVLIATVAGALGRTDAGLAAMGAFLSQVPPDVAKALGGPISDLVTRRASGGLLTIGILVGLWSISGYVDTIGDVIRRAYGAKGASVWRRRLMNTLGVLAAVLLLLIAFTAQFLLVAAEQFVQRVVPVFGDVVVTLKLTRLGPALVMFFAMHALFSLLTPASFAERTREWPGALLAAFVWLGATALLPSILASVANYEVTYGSLAGVMISLLFFYVVALGLVTGANLNAVLAGAHSTYELEHKDKE